MISILKLVGHLLPRIKLTNYNYTKVEQDVNNFFECNDGYIITSLRCHRKPKASERFYYWYERHVRTDGEES